MTWEGSLFDAPGGTFGSFRVLDEIGIGRFGPVYRAQGDAAVVALKVFDQGLSREHASMLAESLRGLCQAPLDHPTIVLPVAAGAEAELAWVAEPLVEATPLDRLLHDGPQPLAELLPHLTYIAGALDFAAAAGIYHGALHPIDILLAENRTFLTGIGVMQALSNAGLDVPMQGAGVSPQRALGKKVTHADDIFALAAIAFAIIYGRPLTDRAQLPTLVTPKPGIDHVRLLDVLAGSLSDDPDKRPSSALQLAAALHAVIVENEMLIPIRESQSHDSNPDPELPIPGQTPLPDSADLPLHVADDAVSHAGPRFAPVSIAPESVAVREPVTGTPVKSESAPRSQWFPIAAALAIGILTGFASGFIIGQRDGTTTPAPRSAERAIPRAQRPSPPPDTPAATTGQEFTESVVPSTRVEDPAVKPTEPGAARDVPTAEPRRPAAPPVEHARTEPSSTGQPARADRVESSSAEPGRTGETSATEPAGRTEVEVVSRPSGAQVFIDGRLAGTTPLMVSGVTPGTHAVRIALPGHQRWVTSVNVEPGARARVAASLER